MSICVYYQGNGVHIQPLNYIKSETKVTRTATTDGHQACRGSRARRGAITGSVNNHTMNVEKGKHGAFFVTVTVLYALPTYLPNGKVTANHLRHLTCKLKTHIIIYKRKPHVCSKILKCETGGTRHFHNTRNALHLSYYYSLFAGLELNCTYQNQEDNSCKINNF